MGKKHGKGCYSWTDGSSFSGQWNNNKISGKGVYKWLDGRQYNGDWLDNNMHGEGVYTWKDGRKYEGQYLFDRKHGYGVYQWADKRRYEGQWKEGKQHGYGKYISQAENQQNSGHNTTPQFITKFGVWEQGKRMKWIENTQELQQAEQEIEKSKRTQIDDYVANVIAETQGMNHQDLNPNQYQIMNAQYSDQQQAHQYTNPTQQYM